MKKILIVFLLSFTTVVFAQEENRIENVIYKSSDNFYSQRNSFWTNLNVIRWVLDTRNSAVKDGDIVSIVETKYENVSYIKSFSVNSKVYRGMVNEKETNSFAIVVDYVDENDQMIITRLWQNRGIPSLFDIENYFLYPFLPNDIYSYRWSDRFGMRTRNGVEEHHNGIDVVTEIGTPIVACLDANMSFGYTPSAGRFTLFPVTRFFWEKVDKTRRTVRRTLVPKFYHLDGLPSQNIMNRFLENPRYNPWFDSEIRKPDEQILQGLLKYYGTDRFKDGLNSGALAQVSRGEIIGLNGWTGDTSSPHLHFEVEIKIEDNTTNIDGKYIHSNSNTSVYLDPEYAIKHFMVKEPNPEDYIKK